MRIETYKDKENRLLVDVRTSQNGYVKAEVQSMIVETNEDETVSDIWNILFHLFGKNVTFEEICYKIEKRLSIKSINLELIDTIRVVES